MIKKLVPIDGQNGNNLANSGSEIDLFRSLQPDCVRVGLRLSAPPPRVLDYLGRICGPLQSQCFLYVKGTLRAKK